MKLFDNYLNALDGVLSKKTTVTPDMLKQQRNFSSNIKKSLNAQSLNESVQTFPTVIEGPKVLFEYDEKFIEDNFGKNPHSFDSISIGAHPDFADLDENDYINHHCVSAFIDIKGSTRLIEKYSLLEVRLIKDSLLTLAILVANQFGGHVHRLQGDGVFLQFVRKNKHENDAIINALNASTILTKFVTDELANIMKTYGLNPLKIRVGIDYGKSNDVLWSYYGIPGCNELTTTSLHTDMAAKLQSKAYDNAILIGGNIKETLDLKPDFISYYRNESNKEHVYYISNQFTYPFFVFNWENYLLTHPNIGKESDGKTLKVKNNIFSIECYISDEDGSNFERYYPNSKSIPKDKKIIFHLKKGYSSHIKQSFEKIEWYAFNSGKQAQENGMTSHDFGKQHNNQIKCTSSAAYLGHHFVECKIIRDHSPTEICRFPIFIQ